MLAGLEAFFVELHKAVKAAVDQGKQAEGLEASLSLPDDAKPWIGESFKAQVKDTYEEISQGKPHGDLPH